MFKMGINHCDCRGMMSKCKAKDDPVGRTLCDFSSGANGCMNFRRNMNDHCDNSEAQWAARYGDTTVVVKTLTEEDVFDIRNNETYPTY